MLRIKVYKDDNTLSNDLVETLRILNDKIYSAQEGITVEDVITCYIQPSAKNRCVGVFLDGEFPVGFMCIQRYLMYIDNTKVNVFRCQSGLLEKYRKNNSTKLFGLRVLLFWMFKYPRKSYFFEVCIHPSSYRSVLNNPYTRVSSWPTEQNIYKESILKYLCGRICDKFNMSVVKNNGVYIHNDGLGAIRGANNKEDNVNSDANFFISKNPNYINGDGIVMIIKLSLKDILLNTLNKVFK